MNLADQLVMVRGNQGFGRKPKRKALLQLLQNGPVDVHHYDQTTGETTIETTQHVEPIIKNNEKLYNSGHDGYSPSRDLRSVASIPLVVIDKLYRQGIDIFKQADWPKIAFLLDSQDWKLFRTSPGKISKRAFREYVAPRQKR